MFLTLLSATKLIIGMSDSLYRNNHTHFIAPILTVYSISKMA